MFFNKKIPPEYKEILQQLKKLKPIDIKESFLESRFIIVDVETTGLDPFHDQLLAIGAVVIENNQLLLGQSWYQVMQPKTITTNNVLIHGLTPNLQKQGLPYQEGLLAFLKFIKNDILIAFHADFDKIVIQRALQKNLNFSLKNKWIDLAWLAPALFSDLNVQHKNLDFWLEHFKLQVYNRHHAVFDAIATAELMLVLLSKAKHNNLLQIKVLMDLAQAQAQAAQMHYGGV